MSRDKNESSTVGLILLGSVVSARAHSSDRNGDALMVTLFIRAYCDIFDCTLALVEIASIRLFLR